MRLKITRDLAGSIDGIQLSDFVKGLTYDVGTTLGSYLLAQGWAEPVGNEEPAPDLPSKIIQTTPDAPRRSRKPRPKDG